MNKINIKELCSYLSKPYCCGYWSATYNTAFYRAVSHDKAFCCIIPEDTICPHYSLHIHFPVKKAPGISVIALIKRLFRYEKTNRLLSALWIMRAFFSSSSSGLSLATTIPSSWSSRPSGVIMKFSKVTCEFGEKQKGAQNYTNRLYIHVLYLSACFLLVCKSLFNALSVITQNN